jgi:MFS family permease
MQQELAATKTQTPTLGGARAWFMVGCGGVFYCYQFILRVLPNVLHDEIVTAFAIDASAFSVMVGFYYWAYSGLQIPLGITMDKFGPRRLLSIAGFICGVACFIFSLTSSIYVAGFARFMIGMGAACGFLGTIKLGTLWFPPQKIGNVIALTMIFGTTGATLGGSPLGYLTDYLGWQKSLQFLGLIGLCIGLVFFLFVRDTPTGKIPPKLYGKNEHVLSGFKRVITSSQAWLISGFSMLMYAPLIIMGDAWCVPFIESIYTVDEKLAATVHTSLFIGAALGSPFFTSLSDKLTSRRIPMMIGALFSLGVYMLIIFGNNIPLFFMYVLFFLAGFSYTAKCLCFASMTEIMPPSSSGVSVGFSNMIVMGCGALVHPLIGRMLDYSWNGLVTDGRNVYSELDYRFAMSVIPICLALSLFLVGFIKETHPGRPGRRYE